ncbi:MAG TPA: hypothetical protein VEJ16_12575 [Alphaproteobacteria bacterium]|nr:hypothetical protein [Alphaproteobacteria bacterium]
MLFRRILGMPADRSAHLKRRAPNLYDERRNGYDLAMEVPLTRFLLPIAVLAAALVSATSASAQLLGLEHYLSPPTVDYSADVTMTYLGDSSKTGDDDEIKGKVIRTREKERREMTVEGDLEIMIVRLDRKVVWSISPEEKLYIESPLDEALGRAPGPDGKVKEPEVSLETIGTEAVGGVQATKRKIVGKDVDGSPIDGVVWVSEQGIVVRVDSNVVDEDGKHHTVRMELHNLRVGPQDPKLFEIPADYKRVSQSRLGYNSPAVAERPRSWARI